MNQSWSCLGSQYRSLEGQPSRTSSHGKTAVVTTFRRLPEWPVPTAAVGLLTDIAEAKGRSQPYARQSPQILKALREMALVQSVESRSAVVEKG